VAVKLGMIGHESALKHTHYYPPLQKMCCDIESFLLTYGVCKRGLFCYFKCRAEMEGCQVEGIRLLPLELHSNVAEIARDSTLVNLPGAIGADMLFRSRASRSAGCFEYLLVSQSQPVFFAPFGTANHEDAH